MGAERKGATTCSLLWSWRWDWGIQFRGEDGEWRPEAHLHASLLFVPWQTWLLGFQKVLHGVWVGIMWWVMERKFEVKIFVIYWRSGHQVRLRQVVPYRAGHETGDYISKRQEGEVKICSYPTCCLVGVWSFFICCLMYQEKKNRILSLTIAFYFSKTNIGMIICKYIFSFLIWLFNS